VAGPYRNPFRDATITPQRIDQGVDYSGSGPIYALGPGVIVGVLNPGWPGGAFIVERLTSGTHAGRYVYAAENITPDVRIGQQVDSSTRIGWIRGGIETGFAAPPPNLGESMARLAGQWNSSAPSTAYGKEYSDLLHSLGAPPGVLQGAVSGTVTGGGTGGAPGQQQGVVTGCVPGAMIWLLWILTVLGILVL
jgi:hypothetical protein